MISHFKKDFDLIIGNKFYHSKMIIILNNSRMIKTKSENYYIKTFYDINGLTIGNYTSNNGTFYLNTFYPSIEQILKHVSKPFFIFHMQCKIGKKINKVVAYGYKNEIKR